MTLVSGLFPILEQVFICYCIVRQREIIAMEKEITNQDES